jgi:hypoxanthine phosphoribosyltransferase
MKKYISWNDIDRLANDLAAQIILDCKKNGTTPEETFLCIHAVQRGGYIPGVLLSHKLDIPMADRLNPYYGKRFLVVDDIADTGGTLSRMKAEIYDNAMIATLHYHKQSKVVPDYWVDEKGDDWIVYPWEQDDSDEIQDYLKETK